jgi:CMP-2-keto-3-deoxyoctulosonic acid synthetase
MSARGILPARFASPQFPSEMLAPIDAIPMPQRMWEGARGAVWLGEIGSATGDARVLRTRERFGARAVLAHADHPADADRATEGARRC